MRIGLLVLSVGEFGNKGFYNLQEVGLGKAFGNDGHTVEIYKCVHKSKAGRTEEIAPNVTLHLIGANTLGNNAMFSCEKQLDRNLDVLVCFSDIQFWTTKVCKWAERNQILFIPYVGITHSTSPSLLKRGLINLLARSVFRTYRKTGVLAKTGTIEKELIAKGITDVRTVHVGIDFDLLHRDYDVPKQALLNELGLTPGLQYMLMVGRIESDRNPLDVVTVLDRLHQNNRNFRLIVIGKGSLKEALFASLSEKGLSDCVVYIPQVPNADIWKYYRAADALLSFSRTEIFGMSILEAMYYELPVFVIHAPGPDEIVIDGETGRLVDSPEDMAQAVLAERAGDIGKNGHRHVALHFSWSGMVNAVVEKAGTDDLSGRYENK